MLYPVSLLTQELHPMADWNPSLYLQFDAERTRPAADLLSRIAYLQIEHAVDLGCGLSLGSMYFHWPFTMASVLFRFC